MALALAGRIDFDPMSDALSAPDGSEVRLDPPTGQALPDKGFVLEGRGFTAPPADGSSIELEVTEGSKRLQLLDPFAPNEAGQFSDMPLLLKVSGKCTTDHISAAGPWLRFRGHLENISDNMYIGATNAFSGEVGKGTDALSGDTAVALPDIARRYKAAGLGWVVVGDVNYGEGSSREHAAMSPRFLGCRAVIARSFARIAETNLKKQGVLALTFADPASWELIRDGDRFALAGLDALAPGNTIAVEVTHADGSSDHFDALHTLSPLQIQWWSAGSALNHLRRQPAPAAG